MPQRDVGIGDILCIGRQVVILPHIERRSAGDEQGVGRVDAMDVDEVLAADRRWIAGDDQRDVSFRGADRPQDAVGVVDFQFVFARRPERRVVADGR